VKAFSKVHPFVLMVYFLSVLLVAMFVNNPAVQLTALAGGIAFCAMLTTLKEKVSDLKFYLPLLILISVTNPLFSYNGETPLFFMNGNAVTLEAIIYGVAIGVMIIAVMLWCKGYSYIMTSDKFLFLFGKAVPKLSMVISTALRYIPMLRRQAKGVSRAQRAMGLYTSESYFDKLRFSLRVFSVLVGWSLESAVETGRAMKARGFELKRHSSYSDFRITKSDVTLLLLHIALMCITLTGTAAGAVDFSYYPSISQLTTKPLSIAVYSAFFIISFIPFFIEVEERIKWSCCKSKISVLHTQRPRKKPWTIFHFL